MASQTSSSPSPFELHAGEVAVWLVGLDVLPAEEAGLVSLLQEEELARASRFPFERERRRFTVTRGALRVLLGRYLRLPPAGVGLCYSSCGKPSLDPAHGPAPLGFNVAHSGGKAVLAFSSGRELGVDVEEIRPELATASYARQFFSACEEAEFARLAPALRTLAFYLWWTRKEAFVKAAGQGLSLPLASFDVSLTPGEPALLRAVRGVMDRMDWSLVHLGLLPGYAGALVASGGPFTVRLLQWPPP